MIDWNIIISALLGGVLTLYGAIIVFSKQEKNRKLEQLEHLKSVLNVVKAEVSEFMKLYASRFEDYKSNNPGYMEISSGYFYAYKGLIGYLGSSLINDQSILQDIIKFYVKAFGLRDSHITINKLKDLNDHKNQNHMTKYWGKICENKDDLVKEKEALMVKIDDQIECIDSEIKILQKTFCCLFMFSQ